MSQATELVESKNESLSTLMARQYNVEPKAFLDNIKATCMPGAATNADLMTFLMVCHRYDLNPMVREVYAFPRKGDKGGIQTIVGVDGWMRMVSNNKDFDGVEFEPVMADDKVTAMTCRMYRKGMQRPIEVTEYMSECQRNTDPWKQWPMRMLRHKTYIQAARIAFGITGVVDQDEYDRGEGVVFQGTPRQLPERAKIDINDIKAGNAETHTAVDAPLTPKADPVLHVEKKRGRPKKETVTEPSQAPAAPIPPDEKTDTETSSYELAEKVVLDTVMLVKIKDVVHVKLMTENRDTYFTADTETKAKFDEICKAKTPFDIEYEVVDGRCFIRGLKF